MARKSKSLYAKIQHISRAKFKKTSISINPARIKWSSMNKSKKRNKR